MAELDTRVVHGLTVEVDRSLCVAFGDCVEAAPEAFRVGDDDIVVFVEPERVDRERLLAACDACPVDAITVRDGSGCQLVP